MTPKATEPTTGTTAAVSPMPWTLTPAPSKSSMPCIRDAKGRAVAFVNRGAGAEANARLLVNAARMREALKSLLYQANEADADLPAHKYAYEVLRDIESGAIA